MMPTLSHQKNEEARLKVFKSSDANDFEAELAAPVPEKLKKLYCHLVEYFDGSWHQREKPFTDKKGNVSKADRLVAAMPQSFTDGKSPRRGARDLLLH